MTAAINGSDFVVANVQTNARKASKSYRSNRAGAAQPLRLRQRACSRWRRQVPARRRSSSRTSRPGRAPRAIASAGVELAMDGVKVKWTFDAKSSTYLRFQGGKAHNDAALGQVNADERRRARRRLRAERDLRAEPRSPRPSAPARPTCSPAARWFTAPGAATIGCSRSRLTADDGKPMLLTPGRTWVELARSDSTTPAEPDRTWCPEHQSGTAYSLGPVSRAAVR